MFIILDSSLLAFVRYNKSSLQNQNKFFKISLGGTLSYYFGLCDFGNDLFLCILNGDFAFQNLNYSEPLKQKRFPFFLGPVLSISVVYSFFVRAEQMDMLLLFSPKPVW